MPGTTKRLDLQFGVFACSVQGFDDPVQPVQQVLQALQNLLEETPELADAGISFDAAAIERLVGEVARRADIDEENVEIVPGLIIVHRHTDDAAAGDAQDHGGASDKADEAWSRPFVAGAAESGESAAPDPEPAGAEAPQASPEPEAEQAAEPAYVNIFTPRAHADGGDAEPDSALSGDAADTDLYGAAEAGPARDIFADTGLSAGGGVFADPMAANTGAAPAGEPADGDGDGPVNFFAATDESGGEPDDIGPGDDGPDNAGNVFAGAGSEEAEAEETGGDAPEAAEEPGDEPDRLEALFGRSEDQPVVEEADEGYTAAGLAQTAGAETAADLMVSAAAWMVLIRGQTTFTRHDVIEVFETMPGKHSKTAETRIKGFGKAVRDGQMIMVEEGVYGLSRTELERFQLLL